MAKIWLDASGDTLNLDTLCWAFTASMITAKPLNPSRSI
jgi:hypothetical protein